MRLLGEVLDGHRCRDGLSKFFHFRYLRPTTLYPDAAPQLAKRRLQSAVLLRQFLVEVPKSSHCARRNQLIPSMTPSEPPDPRQSPVLSPIDRLLLFIYSPRTIKTSQSTGMLNFHRA